jgi:hypothetical protein
MIKCAQYSVINEIQKNSMFLLRDMHQLEMNLTLEH